MPAKVFVSCGQATPDEKQTANDIRAWLKGEGFDPYVAIETQSIQDVNSEIIGNLRLADYYVFVDLRREEIGGRSMQWRGSLFTNQELAIAYTLGFDEALFMQQSGVMLEGIGKYILSNARHFDKLDDVLNILKEEITKRQWRPEYSRHLVPTIRNYDHVVEYVEYDRTASHRQYIWHVEIRNRRRDLGAMSTIAILDRIQLPSGETIPSPDRAYLKWAYQADHQRTIPPGESAIFDAFALEDTPTHDTVYLHSLSDFHPRQPVLRNTRGPHVLHYQVFAQGFPLLKFPVLLDITGDMRTTTARIV